MAARKLSAFLRAARGVDFFENIQKQILLHKKMLRDGTRLGGSSSPYRIASPQRNSADAADLLLRAQCNDAYWHGVFGGLYAPHLRTELWRNLIRAESAADKLHFRRTAGRVSSCSTTTLTARTNCCSLRPEYQTLLKPSDGGTRRSTRLSSDRSDADQFHSA